MTPQKVKPQGVAVLSIPSSGVNVLGIANTLMQRNAFR